MAEGMTDAHPRTMNARASIRSTSYALTPRIFPAPNYPPHGRPRAAVEPVRCGRRHQARTGSLAARNRRQTRSDSPGDSPTIALVARANVLLLSPTSSSARRHVHFASPLEIELNAKVRGLTTHKRDTSTKPTIASRLEKTSARATNKRASTPGHRRAEVGPVKQMQTARQRSQMQKLAAAALVRPLLPRRGTLMCRLRSPASHYHPPLCLQRRKVHMRLCRRVLRSLRLLTARNRSVSVRTPESGATLC